MTAQLGPIVVGTDFSNSAAVALVEARRLARLIHTTLQVVHVVDGNPATSWGDEGEAASWLRAAKLEPESLIVRFGSPWAELVRYAADTGPTLVVVGSHGSSGYQPLTIGSTAARVSMHARCPVVLVSPRVGVKSDVVDREAAVSSARNEPG